MFTRSTITQAESDTETLIEKGQFIPDEWIIEWGMSTGQPDIEAFVNRCRAIEQVRLTRHGVVAYAVAGHFQFLAPVAVLRELSPLPSAKLLGSESVLDEQIDAAGYARLSVSRPMVYHLGNTLTHEWRDVLRDFGIQTAPRQAPQSLSAIQRLAKVPVIRRVILRLYRMFSQLVASS
jgi:hypothetical protein